MVLGFIFDSDHLLHNTHNTGKGVSGAPETANAPDNVRYFG
jgi:hypothetical protein